MEVKYKKHQCDVFFVILYYLPKRIHFSLPTHSTTQIGENEVEIEKSKWNIFLYFSRFLE